MKEKAEFNAFQLFEKKQSSVLGLLQGRGWDAGGTHMWWFGSRDPGKPPGMRPASAIGHICALHSQKGCSFILKPSGPD